MCPGDLASTTLFRTLWEAELISTWGLLDEMKYRGAGVDGHALNLRAPVSILGGLARRDPVDTSRATRPRIRSLPWT